MPSHRTDTAPAFAALRDERLRRLSAERRLALAVEMSLDVRSLLLAGLRDAHPTWSAEQVQEESLRLTLLNPSRPYPPR